MLIMIFLLRILLLSHNVPNDRPPKIMFEDMFRAMNKVECSCSKCRIRFLFISDLKLFTLPRYME